MTLNEAYVELTNCSRSNELNGSTKEACKIGADLVKKQMKEVKEKIESDLEDAIHEAINTACAEVEEKYSASMDEIDIGDNMKCSDYVETLAKTLATYMEVNLNA